MKCFSGGKHTFNENLINKNVALEHEPFSQKSISFYHEITIQKFSKAPIVS